MRVPTHPASASVDPAAETYLLTDPRGVIREATPHLAALLNVSTQFLVGRPLLHFVARGDTRAFRDAAKALAPLDHAGALRVALRPRHGRPFAAHLTAVPIGDGDTAALLWLVRPEST